jgi:hypothetical protein
MSGTQPQTQPASAAPIRLLPARALPMSREQEQGLVCALAELLVEWIEARPERLPSSLRTGQRCDLDGCSRAKEQP